ncbi:unnamed protein product [Oikopleura dioica]|uniref:Uncharacterized protein n=1 Tax=Oikopleura dioica TaxID=34765 RepID=E4YT79_OIKDI|nr:unnamed protein product [Oikopleura dioica]
MPKIEELVKIIVKYFEEHAADGEVIFTKQLTTFLTEAFGDKTCPEEKAKQICVLFNEDAADYLKYRPGTVALR